MYFYNAEMVRTMYEERLAEAERRRKLKMIPRRRSGLNRLRDKFRR